MKEQMKRLADLAQMIKETELARLSGAETARRKLRSEAESVRAKQSQSAPTAEPGAAHLSGNAERWQDWCKGRLAQLSAQEAQVAAEAEAQKRTAARAFGRSSVLGQMVARQALQKP